MERRGDNRLLVVSVAQRLLGQRLLAQRVFALGLFALGLMACELGLSQTATGEPAQSSAVSIDEIDNTAQAALLRAEALLDDGQWEEAVENIRRVMETSGSRLIRIGGASHGFTRALPVGQYCQILLANLHERAPEALRIYRRQVDPLAGQRYADALAAREPRLLARIVDELFLSSFGDDASFWLGEFAFERGHLTAARAAWERLGPQFRWRPPAGVQAGADAGYPLWRLVPDTDRAAVWPRIEAALRDRPLPRGWLAYPDTNLDLDEVRASLALASLLEGDRPRATAELALLNQLAPTAQGKIGGRSGKLVSLLAEFRRQIAEWPRPQTDDDWLTFAGSAARNKAVSTDVDVAGVPIWQVSLPRLSAILPGQRPRILRVAEDPDGLLGYHPLIVGDRVVLQQGESFTEFDLHSGELRVGSDRPNLGGEVAEQSLVARRFTTTANLNRLYACVDFDHAPLSRIVGLDLRADFKLVLDVRLSGSEWDGAWRFSGAPVTDGSRLYVAVRRTNQVRPEAHVACFDARSGRLCWRRFVCAADAQLPPHPELAQNLLTMDEETLYLNTNLGVVAALRAEDGQVQWTVQYPRVDLQQPDPDRNELHLMRDLNPCLAYRGMVMVAPRDCQHLFCLDAITGTVLWATPAGQGADVVHLLGVGQGRLLASGECLYWFDIATGQLVCRFPASFQSGAGRARPSPRGYGRGLLAGDRVLWPTRQAIYVFQQRTIKTERGRQPALIRRIELAGRGATGGNLLIADGVLLIAAADRLLAFNEVGPLVYDRRPASGRPAE